MKLTDFDKARSLEDLWIRGEGKIRDSRISTQEKVDPKPITLAEAWRRFLLQAKTRKLSQSSIYKYDLLRKRMEDFRE